MIRVIYAFPTMGKTHARDKLAKLNVQTWDSDDYIKIGDSRAHKIMRSFDLIEDVEKEETKDPSQLYIVLTNLNFGPLYTRVSQAYLPKMGRLQHHLDKGRDDLAPLVDLFDTWESDMISRVLPSGMSFGRHIGVIPCSPLPLTAMKQGSYSYILDHDVYLSDVLLSNN